MPVNALSTSGTDVSESTANEESTESLDTSSAELATNSDALSEDTSISEISSNDIDSSEEKLNNEISLQSDNTEDEEEPSTDNWELSTVFYDSTVNNGKTPLTEIDWDASSIGYDKSETRVITQQIKYKNSNTITNYNVGDVEIAVPNLAHGCRVGQINANIDVSANYKTSTGTLKTGEDWNLESFKQSSYPYTEITYPSSNMINLVFSNAVPFEEKNNFEGTIQIVYTITSRAENGSYDSNESKWYQPEYYDDECEHEYNTSLKATMRIKIDEEIIESPNYPEKYSAGIQENDTYWELSRDGCNYIRILFDRTSHLYSGYSGDHLYLYNKLNEKIKDFSGNSFAYYGISHEFLESYLKLTMYSMSNSSGEKGFQATISYFKTIESNELKFSFYRKYIHPWNKAPYTIEKVATALKASDGLPDNSSEYIWVKYDFTIKTVGPSNDTSRYPWIVCRNWYIEDIFDSDCLVLDMDMNVKDSEETNEAAKKYKIEKNLNPNASSGNTSFKLDSLFVGYPKEKYNEENNNLNISNTVELFGKYQNSSNYEYLDTDTVNLNLNEFGFTYSGELYGINKTSNLYPSTVYSQFMLSKNNSMGKDITSWSYGITVINNGKPLTIRYGDDLLYITDSNKNYRKLDDEEYFYTSVTIPNLVNLNGNSIDYDKYNSFLYVRKAGKKEYELYRKIEKSDSLKHVSFSKEDEIVAYYIEVQDLKESALCTTSNTTGNYHTDQIRIKPNGNISVSGTIYNFNYLQVFAKDENDNLILQNGQTEDSYTSIMTQLEIGEHDKETYEEYLQRAYATQSYSEYKVKNINETYQAYQTISSKLTQEAENERFVGKVQAGISLYGFDDDNYNSNYLQELYLDYIDQLQSKFISKLNVYDLLPEGMDTYSKEDEILNSIEVIRATSWYKNFFDKNGNALFNDSTEFVEYMKDHSTVKIIRNWNNTNRTKIECNVDLTDNPVLFLNEDGYVPPTLCMSYDVTVSYDNYLEFGQTYKNYVYADAYYINDKLLNIKYYWYDRENVTVTDNGFHDSQASDINENGITAETISYRLGNTSFDNVTGTHQDVQTQVKTSNDNFTVGKSHSPYGDEYIYKLRIRTGSNPVTNVVIANNLEMAYGKKKFWQGSFLGIDTSYIENKTWMVYDPNNEKANAEGYVSEKIKVVPYYSESENETDLYETEMTTITDGSSEVSKTIFKLDSNSNIVKNSNWKPYSDDVDKSKVKSLAFELINAETGETAVIPDKSLVYVLVKMKAPDDPYINDNSVKEEDRPLPKDIRTYAYNNCWTQWNPIDEFNQKIDFVTGINSNTVRVALPYTSEDVPIINLSFIKVIDGTDENFEKLQLKKDNTYRFQIVLTNQNTGDIIKGILDSKKGLIISDIPIGTYLITESDDMYFDFADMTFDTADGIIFEKTDGGYLLTIDEAISEDTTFEITVNNKIEPDRPYEDKKERVNLFDWTSDENSEEANLLSRVMNFFTN